MTNPNIKLAIVGVGKIVRDQHLPSIAKSGAYDLVATASRNGTVDGVAAYKDIEAMLRAQPDIEAVALCMPPQYRYEAAQFALQQGVDVLLEKPPGATVCEVEQLAALADDNSCCLYTTWHSRHAPSVELARAFLAADDAQIMRVDIAWKEDVTKWHPNQDWIWQAGGLGVFDPGINGLSILTHIVPEAFFVHRAELSFPSNKAAPIAANIDFRTASGIAIDGVFDWRISGDEQWNITVHTNKGVLSLSHGGSKLLLDGKPVKASNGKAHSEHVEYEAIYANFVNVVRQRQNMVDLQPLKLVADAFLLGHRKEVDAFEG